MCLYFSDLVESSAHAAQKRLPMALARSTQMAYNSMFRTFVAFLICARTEFHQVNASVILAFLECLVMNGIKASQLQNYISAIRTMHVCHGMNVSYFDHPSIPLFIKSIQKTSTFKVNLKHIVDISLLKSIVATCDLTYLGYIFKTCYLMAFFGFFRLSNLVPHTTSSFSMLKHVTKGDVFFNKKSTTILITWSKTMQDNKQAKLIELPVLNNSLCPTNAIKFCLKSTPGDRNSPLFQYKVGQAWCPMTDNRVRKHLKNILSFLNLDPDFITFHSFRCSGATFAFNHNVPLQEIQKHGTWTSDCVWRYISDTANAGSQVSQTFATCPS